MCLSFFSTKKKVDSSQKYVIAVHGATGQQGGSVAKSLLNEGKYQVRALTRNPDSEKSKALKKLGADVVKVDMNDYQTIEDAYKNCYGVYGVTAYWEHMDPNTEKKQAQYMADAAKKNNIQHFVWSTQQDTRKFTKGDMPKIHEKYQCPDLESKNESNEFFKQNNVPTTFVVLSYYFDNYYTAGAPITNGDGTYSVYMNMGDANLSAMSVKDIGICVSSIFDNKKYIGEHINLSGEFLKIETLCQLLSKKLNKQITYVPLSNDDYRAQEFPGAIDIGNMYQYYTESADIISRNTDMSLVKKLNPKMQTFEAFLDEFSQNFQLE